MKKRIFALTFILLLSMTVLAGCEKERVNLTEKIFDYGVGYSTASNKDYEREGKYIIQLFGNQQEKILKTKFKILATFIQL